MKAVSDVIAPLSGEVLEVNAEGRRRARDGERGPVRRRLARSGSASPTRRRPTLCSTSAAYKQDLGRSRVSYLSLTDADRERDARGDRRRLRRGALPRHPRRRPVRARARPRAGALRAGALAPPRGARRPQRRQRAASCRSSAPASTTTTSPRSSTRCSQRGEFLTAYTPYQPEMSQGVLQAIFEYQTVICELTGMDVSNASGYDGTTVAADACYVAKHATGRTKVVVTEATNPQVRQVVKTYAPGFGLEVVEVPHRGGATDPGELRAGGDRRSLPSSSSSRTSSECLEPAPDLAAAANEAGALAVAHVDPISLGVLEAPGAYGCAHRDRRGPERGQLPVLRRARTTGSSRRSTTSSGACRVASSARRLDTAGERGYVLTLQTREQHIRREKATSNITTNQTLLALGGLVHLSWLGPQGLREVGETCMSLAQYAKERLAEAGFEPLFPEQTTFKEFAIRVGRNAQRRDSSDARARRSSRLRARPRLRGPRRCTARRGDGEAYARRHRPARRGAREVAQMKLIFEKSQAGRRGGDAAAATTFRLPRCPRSCAAQTPPRLPELAEPEIVRHFTRALDAQLRDRHRLLPARLVHDEVQPARQRAARRRCPASRDLHPLPGRGRDRRERSS